MMRGSQWADAEEVPLAVFLATAESDDAAAAAHARNLAHQSLSQSPN